MDNKTKVILLTFTICLLFAGITAVSAASDNTNTTISDTQTISDTSSVQSQTQDIATNTKVADVKKNIKNNNKEIKDIKSTNKKTVDKKITTKNNLTDNTLSNTKNIKKDTNIILNATTFNSYVTNNTFNDNVASGSTIDIQGKLDDPRFALTINKPVNIISSTHDAYISLDTTSSDFFGKNPGDCFIISKEGSGTNITGITFYNTQIFVKNAENVTFDNITAINENQEIGGGVGVLCVRENSSYVTVKNSYFRTKDNGGHSTLVGAWVNHCTFDNNTIEGLGMCGNLVYLTTYNVDIPDLAHTNEYNKITNNKITGQNSQAICYGICVAGSNNLIENNTINYDGMGITTQWGSGTTDWTGTGIKTTDNTYNNNILNGGSFLVPTQSSVNNNTVSGAMTISSGSTVTNNNIHDVNILGNSTFKNNKVSGTVTIRGSNVTLDDNTISTDNNYTITVNENLKNITISNNHLASAIGRSDDTINNNSEVVLNNNNATSKNIYINEDNVWNYFTRDNTAYLITSQFVNNDVLYLNITSRLTTPQNTNIDWFFFTDSEFLMNILMGRPSTSSNNLTLSIGYIYLRYPSDTYFGHLVNNTIKNVYMPDTANYDIPQLNNNCVNTTFSNNNNIKLNDNSFESNGTLKSNIATSLNLTKHYNLNISTIIFDRPVNLTASWNAEHYNQTVIFMYGSEGSNVTGNVFDNKVVVNASSINFYNNTFNNGLEFNTANGVLLDSNIINNENVTLKEVLNSNIRNNIFSNSSIMLNDSLRNNIVNNSITTTGDSTVVLNENSANNNISDNYLVANSTAGDLSVAGEGNIVNNNTPLDNVTVTINADSTMFINTTYPVSITVTDNNRTVDNGYVTVYVYGIPQGNYTLVNGTANTNVTLNDTGNIRIKAWYYPTTKYNIGNNKLIVNAIKVGTRININNITARYGDNIVITGTVTDENNNNINTGVINITAGDETETVNITNGTFTLNTTVAESWYNKNITAYYDGNEVYANTTTSITPALTKGDTVISFNNTVNSNNDISLTATLTNQNGALITSGQIVFRDANGRLIDMASVTNGSYTINYTPQSNDDVTITVTYRGNNYYNEKTANATIILVRNTTTSVSPVTGFVGNNITITASVNSSEIVNEGIVVFTTGNGTVLGSSNVTNGTATVTVVFNNAVNDTVIASYNQTGKYNPSTANNTLNINKIDTVITAGNMTAKLGSTVTLNAAIKDINGNSITGGTVLVKINGKSHGYANITNNGEILYNIILTPEQYGKGTYTITYVYSETNTTLATRTNTTLQVTPYTPKITLRVNATDIGDNVLMTVTVTNGDNYSALSGNIKFKLNGITYKINKEPVKVQVTNGTAVLSFYASRKFIGNNNITILYSGNGKFDSIAENFTNILTINAYKQTTITTQPVTAKLGRNITITAKITDNNQKPLTQGVVAIKINGKTFGHADITNGTVNFNQYLDPAKFSAKNYTITIKFGGKGKYSPAQINTTLTINKNTPTITYNKITVKNSTTARITATIKDGNLNANNGTVGLKINGNTYKVNKQPVITTPNSNGTVTFNVPTSNLQKNNNLTFTYSGYRVFNGIKTTITNAITVRN